MAETKKKKLVPLVVAGVAGAAILVGGVFWYIDKQRFESTDNAFVQADTVSVSPQVTGYVAQVLVAGADFGQGRHATVFLASDSAAAKQVANTLARSMGFEVVDAGGLKNARYLEPLAGLNIYLGYGAGLGTTVAPTWIHRA